MDLDPTVLTAIAVTASMSGLLLDPVRRLLSSIFRRPSKNTVLVKYDDAVMSVDLDENVYRALRATALRSGLTEDQSKRLAEAVVRQLADQQGMNPSSSAKTDEVPDAR